jgi:hypothetical protein
METRIGPQTPYEVYCYSCRVTFPVGTRVCVHCGRPIGTPFAAPGALPVGPGAGAGTARDELGEPADPLSIARRLGGASLWVLIAIAAALTRFCSEG